jgi:adenine-specific DNA methylase
MRHSLVEPRAPQARPHLQARASGDPMIPKDCKRLAEVDFPIAVVSKHAAREKSIRHGHPSTLHLWWARRPLASSRAVLLGLLWPDPCDPLCPAEFKAAARELLPQVQGKVGPADDDLRAALLRFIGDFANWDLAANPSYLEVGRALVRAAHPEEPPLVVDPFAGGGSIPLEALRLGADAFASDLNPVACMILKVMLEDIPRHGPGLADELRSVGAEIKAAAERELGELYPPDPDGGRPIAYLWARTVRCETSGCGAEIPLLRSFWLAKKANRRRALRARVDRADGGAPRIEFEIFSPASEVEVPTGTVSHAKATCPACRTVLPPERVRAQLAAQRGGADVVFDANGWRIGGARMLAVVTLRPGEQGRHYRLPTERDYETVRKAQERVAAILGEWERGGKQGLCPVPDEPTPAGGGSGAGRAFSVQRYGMLHWGDLFTARQKVALASIGYLVGQVAEVVRPLSLSLGKLADLANVVCPWEPIAECPRNVLSNGRIKPSWDFAEGVPVSDSSGSLVVCVENLAGGVASVRGVSHAADPLLAAAQASPLPGEAAQVWFTDPPYYDAIPYADLSDLFYVWYQRVLPPGVVPRDPFDPANPLTPKTCEAVQDETKRDNGRAKDRAWFEETMAKAFAEGRRVLREDGVGAVVFAHKTTEGWEALLSGMIRGGWTITGSWPIATEMGSRLRARESAALATSVHLICRPRPDDAPVGDWADLLRELPRRVGDWMERLQREGVRGADLVFACIGPALEIFSRYRKVETAEGREVALAEYLEKVWEVVGRAALTQVLGAGEHGAGALEEDARLTALFLWTLQGSNGTAANAGLADPTADATDEGEEDEGADEDDEDDPRGRTPKGYTLVFDVARRFAQPLGIHLDDWEGRIIETKKGAVRLLPVAERARQLFGPGGARVMAERLEQPAGSSAQLSLFPEMEPVVRGRARRGPVALDPATVTRATRREATTLDRVHAAMLLQASGQATALRNLLVAEQERGPEFLRLANALSALYPRVSEEKRLLDAMLLAVPR